MLVAVRDSFDRVFCGGWCTRWEPTEEQRQHWPPRHSDFRDSPPQPLQSVYELYQPVVQEGRWTEGLLEMWWRKNKPVKHSVHIPCWDSYRIDPRKWRGVCFGRTVRECFWTGNRQMRWTRAVYAAGLGREYVMPVRNIGRHGYKSDLKALCWMYCLLSCIFSCGIGQAVTCCGSFLITNFAAWYSCHARERLRRRYKLPPTCGLPPGIDDCLVHFYCFYCAAHQEVRELAVRGIDGPGMHILDVLPHSFDTAPGIEEARAERRALLEGMLARPPKMFRARGRQADVLAAQREHPRKARLRQAVADAAVTLADRATSAVAPYEQEQEQEDLLIHLDDSASVASDTSSEAGLGWKQYCPTCPPGEQEMQRGGVGAAGGDGKQQVWAQPLPPNFQRHSMRHIPVLVEAAPAAQGPAATTGAAAGEAAAAGAARQAEQEEDQQPLRRAWSIAY